VLEKLPKHTAWWFRSDAMPLTDWLDDVAVHRIWSDVADLAPKSFSVSQDIA
jgi:hypothetical protein